MTIARSTDSIVTSLSKTIFATSSHKPFLILCGSASNVNHWSSALFTSMSKSKILSLNPCSKKSHCLSFAIWSIMLIQPCSSQQVRSCMRIFGRLCCAIRLSKIYKKWQVITPFNPCLTILTMNCTKSMSRSCSLPKNSRHISIQQNNYLSTMIFLSLMPSKPLLT